MTRSIPSLLRTALVGSALLASLGFAATPPTPATQPTPPAIKLPVMASFSILGDLLHAVGGARVSVASLVGPNQDAHTFEPKPTDAKAIVQSRLLVTNGLGFEPWAEKLAKSAGFKGTLLVASNGVPAPAAQTSTLPAHGKQPSATSAKPAKPAKSAKNHDDHDDHGHAHGAIDPHAWQNPQNVVIYVRNIAAALTQADPAGAAVYQANADAYIQQLQALDAWAQAQFAAIPASKRKVITAHDAFGYLAQRYGIVFLAPQGLSSEAAPSAKAVAQLIRQIQREKIKAVFIENMGDPKLLTQLSRDAGVHIGASLYTDALSLADQPGASYLQMMRHNVTQLVAGMQQN